MKKPTRKELLTRYKDSGVIKYTVSTSGDERVCPACAAHDGKTYKVSELAVGKNHPPFCDKCRCITLPGFDIPGVVLPWENK